MITIPLSRPGGLVSLCWSERRSWANTMDRLTRMGYRMVFSTPEQWNALQTFGSWLIFMLFIGIWRPRPGWIITAEPILYPQPGSGISITKETL